MYSLRFSQDPTPKSSLSKVMATLADIPTRLQLRRTTPPAEFEEIMKLREDTHHKCPYTPVSDIKDLFPGTYYLAQVDDKYRRTYLRVLPTSCEPCSPLISPARLFNGSCQELTMCVCEIFQYKNQYYLLYYIIDNTIKDGVKSVSLIYDVSVCLNVIFNQE